MILQSGHMEEEHSMEKEHSMEEEHSTVNLIGVQYKIRNTEAVVG